MKLQPPSLLASHHLLESFSCGVPCLDEWLKKRALSNQIRGISRTYVLAEQNRVSGYYCLSSGGLALGDAPGHIRRNMPDPVPVVLLGRLAVDRARHGQGLGSALLQDAVLRTLQACEILGIRGILVHALSDSAKSFYESFGFTASPTRPMTLVLSLKAGL